MPPSWPASRTLDALAAAVEAFDDTGHLHLGVLDHDTNWWCLGCDAEVLHASGAPMQHQPSCQTMAIRHALNAYRAARRAP